MKLWTEYWKAYFGTNADEQIYGAEIKRKFNDVSNDMIVDAIDLMQNKGVQRPTLKDLMKAMYEVKTVKKTNIHDHGDNRCQPCAGAGWVEYNTPIEHDPDYMIMIPCICEKGRAICRKKYSFCEDKQYKVAQKAVKEWWDNRNRVIEKPQDNNTDEDMPF